MNSIPRSDTKGTYRTGPVADTERSRRVATFHCRNYKNNCLENSTHIKSSR